MNELAMIVGAGRGLSASLARLCASEGMDVVLAARDTAKPLGAGGRRSARAPMPATRAGAKTSMPCSTRCSTPGGRRISSCSTPALGWCAGRGRRPGPGGGRAGDRGRGLWWLPCRPPGCDGDAVNGGRGRSVHRRLGQRQGLPGIGLLRDGQVRSSRACAEHGAGAGPQGDPCRTLRHRRRYREPVARPDHDEWLDPDAIARTFLHVHRQHRSAWTWEVELRPWIEHF